MSHTRELTVTLVLVFMFVTYRVPLQAEDTAPLVVSTQLKEVGTVDLPTSCTGEGVQDRLNRGLALLHHMTYEVAEREFQTVAEQDPTCAMAYWGIAMTLVHPVWPGFPSEVVLKKGASAVQRARELGGKTEQERLYIEAIGAFYDEWDTVDHRTRLNRWDRAQKRVTDVFPHDNEASALYALVHVAASPKEDLTYAYNREAGVILEKLLARQPTHPGALHYGIHAYDNPPLARKALEMARTYGQVAPEIPHALHMPTHIFTRLGYWQESITWNRHAREAARSIRVEGGIYGEFAHASDYMTYAFLQLGQDAKALAAQQELLKPEHFHDHFASAYALAAVPARIVLERAQWEAAATLRARQPETFPWEKYPWCEAISHFARGVGAARSGNLSAAQDSIRILGGIAEQAAQADLNYWMQQVKVQQVTIQAWRAYAENRTEEALRTMTEAAELEDSLDKHPITPGAVLPARELLGDMLMEVGRYGDALKAYEATLRISPNRFNSLAGAGRAAERAGMSAEATTYYKQLLAQASEGDTRRPGVTYARTFLGAK
jgi:tetratricopeptide (TPR) repeat protein